MISIRWFSIIFLFIYLFLKILFIYSFMRDRETERERERERETERQRHRQREKQAPYREPDMGLYPRSPGSGPRLKAGAKPLSHPGISSLGFSSLLRSI